MDIELAYNSDKITFTVPDSCLVDHFEPKSSGRTLSYDDFVSEYNHADVDTVVNKGSILIVVNDAHRSTPTPQLLQWVKEFR
ncbi:MAG: hypothetical protein OQJ81_04205, partial [Melioribacteraceae bacterium]|nr:hypothetical protein [Melioribacteraceae bacterium]